MAVKINGQFFLQVLRVFFLSGDTGAEGPQQACFLKRTRISRFLPPVERPLMDSPREEWTAEAAKSMMPRFTGVKDR